MYNHLDYAQQEMMEMAAVPTGTLGCAKLQSAHHHQHTNTQFSDRLDALTAKPTVSKQISLS